MFAYNHLHVFFFFFAYNKIKKKICFCWFSVQRCSIYLFCPFQMFPSGQEAVFNFIFGNTYCVFNFNNHRYVVISFSFQSWAEGETFFLFIFPSLCVFYKSGELATGAVPRNHLQTGPFPKAGRIQGKWIHLNLSAQIKLLGYFCSKLQTK